MKDVELYNGDCIEVLGSLCYTHLGMVDCIITDPPYNVSRENNFTSGSASRIGMDFGEWDKDFNITEFIYHAQPLLKENGNIVIFNAWENLGDIKHVCEDCFNEIKTKSYFIREVFYEVSSSKQRPSV